MCEFECRNCGPLSENEVRDTLGGKICPDCKTKVGKTSDEIVEKVKDDHPHLGDESEDDDSDDGNESEIDRGEGVETDGGIETAEDLLDEIAHRTAELGSVARAVDTLATDEFGRSKSEWADETDRNPSTISRTTDVDGDDISERIDIVDSGWH